MELSNHHSSPPSTYSYVQEENLGSTRKFVENHLLFTCITNQILALCTILSLRRVLNHLQKQDTWAKHTSLIRWGWGILRRFVLYFYNSFH
jgi:hypothetical protein